MIALIGRAIKTPPAAKTGAKRRATPKVKSEPVQKTEEAETELDHESDEPPPRKKRVKKDQGNCLNDFFQGYGPLKFWQCGYFSLA